MRAIKNQSSRLLTKTKRMQFAYGNIWALNGNRNIIFNWHEIMNSCNIYEMEKNHEMETRFT